jgi:hypothetical protein
MKAIVKTFEEENDDFHADLCNTASKILLYDNSVVLELKMLLAEHKKPRPSAESAQYHRWIVQTALEQILARLEPKDDLIPAEVTEPPQPPQPPQPLKTLEARSFGGSWHVVDPDLCDSDEWITLGEFATLEEAELWMDGYLAGWRPQHLPSGI